MTTLYNPSTANLYPRSVADFRAAFPNLAVGDNPRDEDVAPYGWRVVAPIAPPVPASGQQAVELPPVEVAGQWQQAWQLVDVPPPPPPSDVLGFFSELSRNPAIATPIGDLLSEMMQPRPNPAHAPQAALGLGVGLGQVADRGDPRVFLDAWHQALERGLLGPELIAGVQQLAQSHNLPAEFIAALQPSVTP